MTGLQEYRKEQISTLKVIGQKRKQIIEECFEEIRASSGLSIVGRLIWPGINRAIARAEDRMLKVDSLVVIGDAVDAVMECVEHMGPLAEGEKMTQKYKCRMCRRIDEFEPSPTAEEQETVYIIACQHCGTQNRVKVDNDI